MIKDYVYKRYIVSFYQNFLCLVCLRGVYFYIKVENKLCEGGEEKNIECVLKVYKEDNEKIFDILCFLEIVY